MLIWAYKIIFHGRKKYSFYLFITIIILENSVWTWGYYHIHIKETYINRKKNNYKKVLMFKIVLLANYLDANLWNLNLGFVSSRQKSHWWILGADAVVTFLKLIGRALMSGFVPEGPISVRYASMFPYLDFPYHSKK